MRSLAHIAFLSAICMASCTGERGTNNAPMGSEGCGACNSVPVWLNNGYDVWIDKELDGQREAKLPSDVGRRIKEMLDELPWEGKSMPVMFAKGDYTILFGPGEGEWQGWVYIYTTDAEWTVSDLRRGWTAEIAADHAFAKYLEEAYRNAQTDK